MSNSTFYRHKAKFYDPVSDIWSTAAASENESSSDSEIEFDRGCDYAELPGAI